ncbi:hypothetical protein BY996DRAFT_7130566 [Phakopsora pachyrhizi]|uniref:TMEM205-like domain-containing protein n=1 Tax=Phakopsora pachyrhizi TaxID=170000 RepID=A0AAV0BFB7_PHAPC|nr:hypothetical protein BY996DRAFT_7130566 [Phakopsora pachyrhizi]CAH7685482.1 hypothetical protein PPACK8108_LOCUS20014 [Phakopsora pachyrhizi]
MSDDDRLKLFKVLITSPRSLFNLLISINVGVGVWVSLVGGWVSYRNLPNPTFGKLQSKLLPAYFRLTTLSSTVLLLLFKTSNSIRFEHRSILSVSLLSMTLSSLLNLIFIGPKTTGIMNDRHSLRAKIRSKKLQSEKPGEIHHHDGESEREKDPLLDDEVDEVDKAQLIGLNKAFKKFHSVSTSLNLFGFLVPSFLTSLYVGHHGL